MICAAVQNVYAGDGTIFLLLKRMHSFCCVYSLSLLVADPVTAVKISPCHCLLLLREIFFVCILLIFLIIICLVCMCVCECV